MSKRILVFGATGMLGQSVMDCLSTKVNCETLALGSKDCDVTDRNAVHKIVANFSPDFIINCAAYTAVDAAEDDEESANRLNNLAPLYMSEIAKETKSVLIHISTDYVFDGKKKSPYVESDTTNPLGAYGRTKLLGERAIESSGCHYIIIRVQWLYSWRGKNFFLTMLRLFANKPQIGVVNDQIGAPTYTGNLAYAITQVVDNYHADFDGIYHYSNDGECSWYEFACFIAKISMTKCTINSLSTAQYPTRAVRPCYSKLCTNKFVGTFGISPISWQKGVEQCYVEWRAKGNL